ncbi:hypothetical protein WMF11_19395 [Sorangium sp. So ce295]|uniref:hypothetical protein n=1 Tax=Sorangium sp. So ce295 TaxID=3133295 RepID=UPI003F5E3BA2
MGMKRIGQVLTALAVIGAVTMFVLEWRRQEAQEAELARMRAEMGELSRDLEEARGGTASAESVRRLERRLEAAARPNAALRPASGEEADASGQPDDEQGESPAPAGPRPVDMAEVSERIQDVFAQQTTDTQWTASASEAAREKLSSALPERSSLRTVECRSSMCRFETEHDDMAQMQQFMQEAFMDPQKRPWNGGFFAMPVSDPNTGKVMVVSYLAREGEELPMPL